MAKKSITARQNKREKMVAQYAEKRAALKAAGDYAGLDELPKNASPVRLKNRCQLTGRGRGYMRYFGVSRVMFRDMALNGKIPGVKRRAGNTANPEREVCAGIEYDAQSKQFLNHSIKE